MTRVLLIFVDGVGVGADDAATNAFTAAPPPVITEVAANGHAIMRPLEATLGVSGLPQSGTGQFSLLTGTNGAQLFGRHHGPWVPTRLRPLVQSDSLLAKARQAGKQVAFANAYPEELIAAVHAGGAFAPTGPLRAGPPLAAAGAGVLTRHTEALQRGDAISSEITNEAWRTRLQRTALPVISPWSAGRNLARIAATHDLTLYAHYATDQAGHARDLQSAIAALHLVDEFTGGVIDALPADVLLIIASDHGNLEDASAAHTRNPALCLVYGQKAEAVAARLHTICDVAPAILNALEVTPSPQPMR